MTVDNGLVEPAPSQHQLESVPEEGSEDEGSTAARPAGILYELLVLCEWHLEPRLESPEHAPSPSLRQWVSSLRSSATPLLPEAAAELARCLPAWQLDLSSDGRLLAVLRDDGVEVRSARDSFASTVCTAPLVADTHPQRRRVRWAPAGSAGSDGEPPPPPPLLAVAASSGAVDVLDPSLSPICIIYPGGGGGGGAAPVAELAWAPARAAGWQALLLVVAYSGEVSGYHLSAADGYQHVFTTALKLYPRGISSATYDEQRRLLVVAGESSQVGCERLQGLGSCEGITVWRLVNGPPHLQLCQTEQEKETSPSLLSLLWRRGGGGGGTSWDAVTVLTLSPGARRLISVHRSGAVTVWQFPSLRKQSHWPLQAQPGHEAVSPALLRLPTARRLRRLRELGSGAARPAAAAWWTDDAAVLARANGALTVSDADTLENLLGESAEFFSGATRVLTTNTETHPSSTPAPGGTSSTGSGTTTQRACLVLECERSTQPARRDCSESGRTTDEEEDAAAEEEEEEPVPGVPRRLLDGVRSGLHWLTDSERFEPARRRARLTRTLYRLTCLRSTTPQQLYARKIELGEYGEALLLAEAYGLDSDMVFLRQWQKAEVSAASISDYLGRICRRALVLTECVSRVPSDPAAALLLLEHGLRGTDLEAALAAADPASDQLQLCDPRRCYDNLPPEELAVRERAARRQLMARLAASPLTDSQRQLLEYRRRLLTYRERLRTYRRLVDAAGRQYDPAEYRRFRDRTALEAALEFAHRSDWEALQVMLRYHGGELAAHRLMLLSHIPETTEPTLYAPLLPELDSGGRVLPLETERWEDPDWVDSLLLDDGSPARHRPSEAECPPYATPCRELSSAQLTAWYCGRARELVARSGLVGHGAQLVQLGRERGVTGLETLADDLATLDTLVYDAGHLEVTLDSFAELSPERVVSLMMAGTTDTTFVPHMRGRLLPYLSRRTPDVSAALLRSYILSVAREDLTLPALLVEKSAPPEPRPLLTDPEQLTALALDAVYACRKPDAAADARRMVAALPGSPCPEQRRGRELLAARLAAVGLLAAHKQYLSVAELAELAADESRVRALLARLCRTRLRDARVTSEPDWRRLLDDVLEMQQKVFQVVSPQTCQEVFVLALLTSSRPSHIEVAGTLMETCPAAAPPAVTNVYLRRLPFDAAAQLVVSAAKEYFDGSSSLADPGIQLARQCLQLLREPPEPVRRELGLVDSLDYLVKFGVTLLPVQVRLTEDKLSLLRRCLDARPDAYRHDQELLKLSQLLHVPDSWRLLQLTAERALTARDPAAAARACRHLVSGAHTSAWDICRRVAECDAYTDFTDRLSLLSFSLRHCPAQELERLLRLRQRLLAAQLCVRLESSLVSPQSSAASPGDAEVDGVRSAGEGGEDEKDGGGDWDGAESHQRQPPTGAEMADEPRSPGDGEASPVIEGTLNGEKASLDSEKASPDGEKVSSGPEEPTAPPPADEADFSATSLLRSTRGLTGHLVRATANTLQGTTRAVLHVTSETTRAMLQGGSRALGAAQPATDLLRATVARLGATGERGEDGEGGQGAEPAGGALLRPGVPAFAADTVPGCHESALDADYRRFSAPRPLAALRLALAAARLDALQAAAEERDPAPPAEPRLHQLLPPLLAEDTGLALAWSLALPDAALAGCCERWPPAELSLRAAAYCVALRLAARRGADDLLTAPPPQLVAAELERPDTDADGASASELRQLLRQLCERLEDARQARQLLRLDAGVDVTRFASEPAYQRDTILGLAMSDEEPALETAERLARRYGVSPAELARTQIVYLFSAPELTAEEVSERLVRRRLAERALQEPAPLAAALRERVLPSLAGADHERQLSCLSLLLRADPEAAGELSARVTLLRLLRGSAADAELLLRADGQPLANALAAAVTAETVEALEDLAPRLGNAALTASAVSAAWVAISAERSAAPRRKTLDAEQRRLTSLTPADLERCAARLLFGDSALKLPLSDRQELATELRRLAADRTPEEQWRPVLEILDAWSEHLEFLEWDAYTELLESTDDDEYRFARLLDQTRGESALLAALRTRMVVDGCSLPALRRLLAVFPLEATAALPDVLLGALRETAAPLRETGGAALRPLSAVLLQLRRYLDEDGDGLTAEQVVEELRPLCDDTQVEVGRRVKVARLLTKYFPVDRGLFPALVHADTVSALPETPLSAADTRDTAGRAALLRRLCGEAGTVERLGALLGLLHRWPPFPDDMAADPAKSPAIALCERAMELDPAGMGRGFVQSAAAELANTPALPPAAHRRLTEILADAGAGEAALRTALLSSDIDLRRAAVERAARDVEAAARAAPDSATDSPHSLPWPLSPPVLDNLLESGALPLLVGTPLYGPAAARLLDSGGDVAAAAGQLREAGFQSEAAALQFEARAARPMPSHRTIDAAKHAASKVFSKWLH